MLSIVSLLKPSKVNDGLLINLLILTFLILPWKYAAGVCDVVYLPAPTIKGPASFDAGTRAVVTEFSKTPFKYTFKIVPSNVERAVYHWLLLIAVVPTKAIWFDPASSKPVFILLLESITNP